MKWRGQELRELDDRTLLSALATTMKILGAMWTEVARRGLIKKLR